MVVKYEVYNIENNSVQFIIFCITLSMALNSKFGRCVARVAKYNNNVIWSSCKIVWKCHIPWSTIEWKTSCKIPIYKIKHCIMIIINVILSSSCYVWLLTKVFIDWTLFDIAQLDHATNNMKERLVRYFRKMAHLSLTYSWPSGMVLPSLDVLLLQFTILVYEKLHLIFLQIYHSTVYVSPAFHTVSEFGT